MKRVNRILQNHRFIECLNYNIDCEKQRKFCKHDLDHFLNTARIMYIISLENRLFFEKEIVYATALLHDIGKWKQHKEGIPHEKASAELSKEILEECGFTSAEAYEIVKAIKNHRKKGNELCSLSWLIYKGDKLSRGCYNCSAMEECKWSEEKKNNELIY